MSSSAITDVARIAQRVADTGELPDAQFFFEQMCPCCGNQQKVWPMYAASGAPMITQGLILMHGHDASEWTDFVFPCDSKNPIKRMGTHVLAGFIEVYPTDNAGEIRSKINAVSLRLQEEATKK